MSKRKAIGVFLLFFVSIILTTCELQSNKAGNSLTLQILIPGSASGAAKSTRTLATNAKSLEGGASVQVTILTQAGAPWQSSEPISTVGKTSVDYTFVLPPPGTYQVSASLFDGSGNVLAQASTSFTVPTKTNPVVLTMISNDANLSNMVITDSTGTTYPYEPTFSPTTYTYDNAEAILPSPSSTTFTLTLTTQDPNATITSVSQESVSLSHIGSAYTLSFNGYEPETITIVVTAQDGTTTQTYTFTVYASGEG